MILSFKFESRTGDVIRSVETYSLLVLSFKFDQELQMFESRAGDVIRSVETHSLLVFSFKFESRAADV